MPPSLHSGRTRRQVMTILGMAGAAGLAGCLGDDDPGTTPTPGPGNGDPTPTPTPAPTQPEVRGTYRVGISSDADTTIPFLTADTTSGDYQALLMDGAYAVTSDDEIWPLWADISLADGSETTWVVELRDNLVWSDPYGEMTADDWVWYIQEVHQPSENWAGSVDRADWWYTDDGTDHPIPIEQTGTYSFEIHLPDVDPVFPFRPTMWGTQIIPRGAIEDYVDDRDLEGIQQDQSIIEMAYTGNTGPYRLSEWDRDAGWRTVRNEEYYLRDLDADAFPETASAEEIERWQGAPYFEGFQYEVIPEESTLLSALRTGEVDNANIPEPRVAEFQEAVDDVYVNLAPQPYLRVLAFSQRLSGWEALSDADEDYDGAGEVGYGHEHGAEIRRAIGMAIDKQFISDEIEQGLSRTAQTFQPEWSQWYIDEEVEPVGVGDSYGHDMARDALETFLPDGYGYDNGRLIGPEGHDRWPGEPVELEWVHTAGIETYDLTAEHILAELDAIGIGMNIQTVLWETLLGQWLVNEPTQGVDETVWYAGANNAGHPHETVHLNDWDLLYGINFNTYPRTPSSSDVFWQSDGTVNFYGYLEPDDMGSDGDLSMGAMFDQASATVSDDDRLDLFGEIFGRLSRDQPVNFMTMGVDHYGYHNRVAGPSEEFGYDWDLQTFYFTE